MLTENLDIIDIIGDQALDTSNQALSIDKQGKQAKTDKLYDNVTIEPKIKSKSVNKMYEGTKMQTSYQKTKQFDIRVEQEILRLEELARDRGYTKEKQIKIIQSRLVKLEQEMYKNEILVNRSKHTKCGRPKLSVNKVVYLLNTVKDKTISNIIPLVLLQLLMTLLVGYLNEAVKLREYLVIYLLIFLLVESFIYIVESKKLNLKVTRKVQVDLQRNYVELTGVLRYLTEDELRGE